MNGHGEHPDLVSTVVTRATANIATALAGAWTDEIAGRLQDRDVKIAAAGAMFDLVFVAAPAELPAVTSAVPGYPGSLPVRRADLLAALQVVVAARGVSPLLDPRCSTWAAQTAAEFGADTARVIALLAIDPAAYVAGSIERGPGLVLPPDLRRLALAATRDDGDAAGEVARRWARAQQAMRDDLDEMLELIHGVDGDTPAAAVERLTGPARDRAEVLLARTPTQPAPGVHNR